MKVQANFFVSVEEILLTVGRLFQIRVADEVNDFDAVVIHSI